MQLLQREGMLKVVDPASVLQAHEGPMAAAIRADLALRHLLGDFARSVAGELSRYLEAAGTNPADVIAFAQTGQACDETHLRPNRLKESTAMLRV